MVQLIKKGGLRERANRSRHYQGSENTESTLKPNQYRQGSQKPQEQTSKQKSEQDSADQIAETHIKISAS